MEHFSNHIRTGKMGPEIRNPGLEIPRWDLEPGTWDLGPHKWDLEHRTPISSSGTHDAGPLTLDLGPGNQNFQVGPGNRDP